jgi:hypothetical protein
MILKPDATVQRLDLPSFHFPCGKRGYAKWDVFFQASDLQGGRGAAPCG